MSSKLQSVFRLEPYRILIDLGVEVTSENGRYYVPHPTMPGSRMLLDGRSLVSIDPQCSIVACSVYDYARYKLGSYGKVVDFLLDNFQNAAQMSPGTSLVALRPAFVEELSGERKIFESILDLRRRMVSHENLLDAKLWCGHRGLSVEHGWRSFYIAKQEELQPFIRSGEVSLDGKTFIVMPYFANPHTPAWLKVHSVERRSVVTIPINQVQHAYFGLHTCLPDVEEVRIYEDDVTAQVAFSAESVMAHVLVGCVHVGFAAVAETNDYKLQSGVFVQTDKTSFSQIAQANTAVEKMLVAKGSIGDATMHKVSDKGSSWPAHVLNEATRFLQTEGTDSLGLKNLVDVIKTDRSMCETLIRHLEIMKVPDVVARIRQHLNTNQVYEVAGMQVIETSNGYVAKRKNVRSPFTNFTIRFDTRVVFKDADDPLMHCGRCIINGQEFFVSIPSRILNNKPGEIPNICLSAIARSGIENRDNYFPQILDSTLSRKLGDVLKMHSLGKTPTLDGVKRLGWDDQHGVFTAAHWQVNSTGVRPTSRIPYPHSKFLQSYYDFNEYSMPMETSRITSHINTFMCILASGMVRAFLQLAVPPVEIMRNPESINLLHAIFIAFGQQAPIIFGEQRRTVHSILNKTDIFGYPVFGMASGSDVVSGFAYPIFLIADTGMPFHERMDQKAYEQIASYTKEIVSKVVLYCVRNPRDVHRLIPSEFEPMVPGMVHEGREIIKTALNLADLSIFEPDLPTFEGMLHRVAYDKVHEYFRYDMQAQKVYIRMRNFPQVSRKQVVAELQTKNQDVRMHGMHYVECPAEFLMGIFTSFYGRPVKLFHQDPEPDPEESSASGQDAETQSGA